MIVHKVDNNDLLRARCGVTIQKNLRGLDYASTWNPSVGNPVTCADCLLFHRPPKRKIAIWEGVGRKAKP